MDSPPPGMDLHRCRFMPYPSSAINAIAVPFQETADQCSQRNAKFVRVAIGRANGNVEIWNPADGRWIQEMIMYGGKDRSVDGLVWLSDHRKLRLFSIGGASVVTEWDIERGRPKRHEQGNHGEIWCIAAQPHRQDMHHTGKTADAPKLIAGTIDGELVMYNLEDGGFQYERKVMTAPKKRKMTNIVSIAFQHSDIVLAGCSNSSFYVCDIRRGIQLRTISLGSDTAGGAKDIIVWAIKNIPTGNGFVTGDSTGHVCIWHGKTYTMTQKIQAHDQDILSLSISLDGCSIMSGGMDKRAVLIRRQSTNDRFGKVWGRRYHEHDVKALASLETWKGISVCISGGPDACPVIIPLREHGKEAHRTLSNLPQTVPVTSAPNARFIVGWWGREIHLWQLRQSFGSLIDAEEETEQTVEKNHKLLKTIVVKGESSITSAVINNNGTLLVVATTSEVKAFHLSHDNPSKASDIEVTQVPVPEELSHSGATLMQLSPANDSLCLIQDRARIVMAKIGEEVGDDGSTRPMFTSTQTLRRKLRSTGNQQTHVGPLGYYARGIKHVAFSNDGQMLAVADLAGYVDTWISRAPKDVARGGQSDGENNEAPPSDSDSGDSEAEGEDGSAPKWIPNPAKPLPRLLEPLVVLSFTNTVPDADEQTLLVMTSGWYMVLFQPRQGVIAPWSKRNPRSSLPDDFDRTLDLVKGLIWVGPRAWFYGNTLVGMIDFSLDLPKPKGSKYKDADGQKQGFKRKRGYNDSGAGNKLDIGRLAPKRVQLGNGKEWEDVDMEKRPEASADGANDSDIDDEDDEADDDDDDDESNELALAHRQGGQGGQGGQGKTQRKAWWMTYKYRPILGIVPLGNPSAATGSKGGKVTLEAALVERPRWEMDIGVRFIDPEHRDR